MAAKSKGVWLIAAIAIAAAVFIAVTNMKNGLNLEVQNSGDGLAGQDVQQGLSGRDQKVPDQTETSGIKPMHPPKSGSVEAGIIEPMKAVASKDSYAIQVYSFKEKVRAEAALKALEGKRYRVYIMVSDLGERGIWYRVRVGPYNSEIEAQSALEAITKDFKSGIIVTE